MNKQSKQSDLETVSAGQGVAKLLAQFRVSGSFVTCGEAEGVSWGYEDIRLARADGDVGEDGNVA